MQFSIIIPCYNAERYIVETLNSIVHQKKFNGTWEVLVVDDCSTDHSYTLVENYSKQSSVPINLLQNERNSGPAVARNFGLSKAQGEYILFMDSDDYVKDDLLKAIYEKISTTCADVVYYGIYQVLENVTRELPIVKRRDKYAYMALSTGSLCKFATKRSLWEGINLPPINHSEDIAVIPVILSKADIIEALDGCYYYYVNHKGSVSNSHSPRVVEEFHISFNYTYERLADKPEFHEALEFHGIKTILYGTTLNALKCHISQKELLDIWKNFEEKFPQWQNNAYLKEYTRYKRFFLLLVKWHNYSLLRCFNVLHSYLLKRL